MIKILYIEDDSAHIELTQRSLENSGDEFNLQTASTIADAVDLLKNNDYDVILSDYRLPDGSGLDVIRIAHEQMLSTAIVLITNQEDINTAVAALKAGAVDYIVKQSDYLHKLPIVLSNACKHTQIEKQKKAISEIENKYRNIFENAVEGIFQSSPDGYFLSVNPAMAQIFGYKSPEEMIEKVINISTQIHLSADSRNQYIKKLKENGAVENFEAVNLKKDGSIIWTSTNARVVKDKNGKVLYYEGSITDITLQKHAEILLERQLKALTVLHAASVAGTQSNTEDEIIAQVTQITAGIYSDVCGVLLLNDQENILTPHPSYMGANITNWENGYPITEGITGRAVRTESTIRISDITKDPNYIQIASEIKSEICVPFRVHERIIGVFNVESRQIDAFDEEDERLLNTIAGGLGTAIEKLRLFEAEQVQRQRETAILDLLRMAASSLNLNQVLQSILEQLVKVIPSDSGTIQLLDGDHLNIFGTIGNEAITFANRGPLLLSEFPLNNSVVTEKQTVRVNNAPLDNRYQFINKVSNIKSFLGIPLIVKDKTIGMITLDSYQISHFTEQDAELGLALANHASIAIENARLFNEEQKRRKQAEILREATGALTSSFEPDKLFENILIYLSKLVSFDSVSIEIINKGYAEIVAGQNIPKDLIGKKYVFDPMKWGGTENLRKPVIISDIQTDERFIKFEQTNHIRGWMGIPLFSKGNIIGFLNFYSRIPDFFNEEHAAITQTFANQVAIAIENTHLYQEENRRSQIIEAMANIANEIAVTREVIPALDKIAERTLSLLNASSVAIYLLQDDKQTIKIASAQGTYRKELISHTIKIGEGISGKVIANGQPEIVDDVSKDTRSVRVPGTSEKDASFDTMMSAPLILHGNAIGAISVWRLKSIGFFDKSELNFLVSIAHQASISIESVRLFEETTRRAQEAAALAEVSRGISATLQLDNVLESIAIYAKDLLKAETSAAYLTEPGTSLLRAISAIGVDSDEIKNDPLQLGIGILGDIAMRKFGEIVNNTTVDSRAIPVKGTEILPHEHIMGVPVLSNDQLTGLLVVWRVGAEEEFKATELDFLSSLAQQAAVAIENARLFEAEHKRRQEAEVLSQATSALANTLDINNLFENIFDWLKKIAPYDSASIMLLNQGETLRLVAERNLPKHFTVGQNFPMTEKWSEIATGRKPHIIEDAQLNPNFEKWEGTAYIRGWMGIAMFIQDNLTGFINLDSKTAGTYTEEHAILVQTFANQAATAIENARLFELEQKRRKEAETVRQATTILSSLFDLPSLHDAILEWLYKIIPYDSASILELEGDHIRITAAKGLSIPEKASDQIYSSDNILCKIIIETGEPLILEDCEKDPRLEWWRKMENIHGWMGVPLITRGQVVGYITLNRTTPNAFTTNDAIAAQTFAHQAANSLENSRLYTETLQRLEELEMVSRVSYALRTAHDTREMIPILLNEIKANMNTETAAIWLYDPGKNELIPIATSGLLKDLQKSTFRPNEGVVGTVYASGTMHISPSLSRDPMMNSENIDIIDEAWDGITLPIRTVSETIGVLAVYIQAPNKIGQNHIRLMTTLTEIAGNAIYRSNLFERSEEQIRRLTTLREMDIAITSSLDLHITLGILTEHLLTKMDVSAATVLVFNPDSQTLNYYAPTGFKNRENIRTPQNIGDGLAGQILLNRKAIYISNLNKEPDLLQSKPLKSENFISYYAIPLFSKGATRGILETYFRQSFSPSPDWLDFLQTLAEQAIIAIDSAQLFENLQRSNQELSLAYDTTLEGWGKALELRDKETQGHTYRVTNLALELARQMNIPESELLHIRRGALLHDIGKMGVSDIILHKSGSLTKDEVIEMRKHPKYAYDLLYPIAYLRPALDIAYCHHEWWDGTGYPRGLQGEEIPLSARIFAIIDVWDALLSDRPYRLAWPHKKVLKYIKGLSHKQFDPVIVSVFCKLIESDLEYMRPSSTKKIRKNTPIKQAKK